MAVAPIQVPFFTQARPFVDSDGRLTVESHRRLNDALRNITDALNTLLQLPEIQAALVGLGDATTAAQAAADAANAAAGTTQAATSLANSYVTGLTLSATDAGTDATITVSANNRVYGDGTTVSVAGDTVPAQPYSTKLYVYYDDPTRAGGAVTYLATPDPTVAAQTGDRHVVGAVTTPAALGAPVPGVPVSPPGSGAIP